MSLGDLERKARLHLKRNKMTYRDHFVFAASHGVRCVKAGVYLLIHSLLPCFYRRAGSNLVAELEKEFTEHRSTRP